MYDRGDRGGGRIRGDTLWLRGVLLFTRTGKTLRRRGRKRRM